MKSSGRVIPFTAIVGQEEMKKALILNVINPRIGGVLIRGGKGTAKSTAVRGLAELLPEIEVVRNCPFCCDPHDPECMCEQCRGTWERGEILETARRKIRVSDLPLGATEDRVVGTFDIEKAIQEGVRAFDPGLLAAANRGILYVDEVNLLDDHIADLLLDSAALGVNIVEREGVQISHPANFCLVGTMNPEEGEIRPQLLDRFGLQLSVEGLDSPEERVAIVRLINELDSDPSGTMMKYEPLQQEMADRIVRAMDILREVTTADELVEMIVSICLELGITTHRAEIATLRTAKAIAALDGRKEVRFEDVQEALYLALPHRMRRKPFEAPVLDRGNIDAHIEKWKKKRPTESRDRDQQEKEAEATGKVVSPEDAAQDERVFEIGDQIDPRRIRQFEKDKMVRKRVTGRRIRTLSSKRGSYVKSRIPHDKLSDVALDATVRAAAQHMGSGTEGGFAVKVGKEDLREKVRIGKISTPTAFVVDASGSMFTHERMESAKGAVLSMLQDAYQKRDKVGLVAFREHRGEVILPMCTSLDYATECLRDLATGGPTPLSAGLQKGLELLMLEKRKNPEALPLLVLISDGRANVPMAASSKIEDELIELTNLAWKNKLHMIFIDVEQEATASQRHGENKRILQDRMSYYHVEHLSSDTIQGIVSTEKLMLTSSVG